MINPRNVFISTLLLLLLTISTSIGAMSQVNCRYETSVRLGLVWYRVDVLAPENATRAELIYRLSRLYNFVDIGKIYKITTTCK